MGRFTAVQIHANAERDDDPKPGEFTAANNLFEMNTLAIVKDCGEDNSENMDPAVSRGVATSSIVASSNKSFLAVAADGDITVFNLDFAMAYVSRFSLEDSTVCGMAWLDDSNLLAVYSSSRQLHIFSTTADEIFRSMVKSSSSEKPCKFARIASQVVKDRNFDHTCYINIADDLGKVELFKFPYWNSIIAATPANISDVMTRVTQELSYSVGQMNYRASEVVILPGALEYVCSMPDSGSLMMASCKNPNDFMDLTNFDLFGLKIVRIREVALHEAERPQFLAALTNDNVLHFIDMLTFFKLTAKQLNGVKGKVIDFLFIDGADQGLLPSTLALVVEKENKALEIEIRVLGSSELIYSVEIHAGAHLIPAASSCDRVMMVVEPLTGSSGLCEQVKIREITETLPEARLTRLLNKGRFDEAEKFAKQFEIDVQKVYEAKMNYFLLESASSNDDKMFDELMACMKTIKDHNKVGETCYSGATTFNSFEKISKLLSYAATRNITDSEIAEQLNRLSYVLATFRMVIGPEKQTSDNDVWARFVEGVDPKEITPWLQLFFTSVKNGLIPEAHVIWKRHLFGVFGQEDEINEEVIRHMVSACKTAINDSFEVWNVVIEFLEQEVFPECLLNLHSSCPIIVDFLIDLVRRLERYEPARFPSNSLRVAETLERVFQRLTDSAISPAKQASLAFLGRYIILPESGNDCLEEYVMNLRAISRLRTVYNCPIDYDSYVRMNHSQICHKILEASLQNNALLEERITKYARPFMAEHMLDPDQTLFGYIEHIASKCRTHGFSSPTWEEHCLRVCDTIAKYPLKCRAVTLLADGAAPPWSAVLRSHVDAILKNPLSDIEIVNELIAVGYKAELLQILFKYSIKHTMQQSVTESEVMFHRFINFIFLSDDRFQDEERLADAVKATDLFVKLRSTTRGSIEYRTQLEDTYAAFGAYLEAHPKKGIKNVIKFIEQLVDESVTKKTRVAFEIVNRLLIASDSEVEFTNEHILERRIQNTISAESLINRYLIDTHYAELLPRFRGVRKMQELYGRWVTISQLNNNEWKREQLARFIRAQDRTLADILIISDSLCLNSSDAASVALNIAMEDGLPDSVVLIMRSSLRTNYSPTEELCELYVKCASFVIGSLPRLCPDGCELDIMEKTADLVVGLHKALGELTEVVANKLEHLEKVLKFFDFTTIFVMLINQCLMEDDKSSTGDKPIEPDESDTRLKCGISRRLGLYTISNDGPLLTRTDALPLMCAVAPSVIAFEDNMKSTGGEEFVNTQIEAWESLCNFLAMENQDVLLICCRVFAASLHACKEQRSFLPEQLRHSARNICERALQMHPCDLWTTCGILGCFPQEVAMSLIQDLRGFVSSRKAPQTMINYLRTTQFLALCYEESNFYNTLNSSFIVYLWSKKLGKAGASPAMVSKMKARKAQEAIREFAAKMIDPEMVLAFLSEFASYVDSVETEMLKYAVALVTYASSADSNEKAAEYLRIALVTLELCRPPADQAFRRFRTALYTVNPYNYEVIKFIVLRLLEWLPKTESEIEDDPDEPSRFADGCQRIIEVLETTSRLSAITKIEVDWYVELQKSLETDKQQSDEMMAMSAQVNQHAQYGCYVREIFEQGADDSTIDHVAVANQQLQYQREDLLVQSLPKEAHKRLPFHLFLFHRKEDVNRHLYPIVDAEISIFAVNSWYSVVRNVPWLMASGMFPIARLLSTGIVKKCNECIDRGIDLSSIDIACIEDLLHENYSEDTAIKYCFQKLPLSEIKVKILEIGVKVALSTIQAATEGKLHPPLPAQKIAELQENIVRLKVANCRFKTELLIKKIGIYDAKTADLVDHADDLIRHIYTELIDWRDNADISRKTDLIDELVKVNSDVQLDVLQEELIMKWMPEVDVSASFAVDLNDTMGSAPMLGTGASVEDTNEIYTLPFFSISVIRIVHLLKLVDPQILPKIITQFIRCRSVSNIPGGYKSQIRAACVLLRTYANEQLEAAKSDAVNLCAAIERAAYGRLLELAREDIPMENFTRSEKPNLLKAIVAPTKRHTPPLWHLASCLIADFDITDKANAEMLLNKLVSSRKYKTAALLLRHIRVTPQLHCVKMLPSFWARVFDYSIGALDATALDYSAELRFWAMFLISCPVEGGRLFESGRSQLNNLGMSSAAKIVEVASNYTQQRIKSSAPSSKHDIRFNWTINSTNEKRANDSSADEMDV